MQEDQKEEADDTALAKRPSQNQFQDLDNKKQGTDNTVTDASVITEAVLFGADSDQKTDNKPA